MNNPFEKQNYIHYQQQKISSGIDVNAHHYHHHQEQQQQQQSGDACSFWTAPSSSMMQQQYNIQTGQALAPVPSLAVASFHCPVQAHSALPHHVQQQQFSNLPLLSSASFDPFSSATQYPATEPTPVAVDSNIASQQLVTSSQNSFVWAMDQPPAYYNATQPIIQYPQQHHHQRQHALVPTQPPTLPYHHQQEQQLVSTEKNGTQMTTLPSDDFYARNYAAPPSVPLPPRDIRRSTTPTPAAYHDSTYTSTTSTPRNNSNTTANDSRALVTTTRTQTSPPRDVNEMQLQISQIIVQQQSLPPDSSPLPNPDDVIASGHVLSRISFRTILLKKWKQTYWAQYGPHTIILFRSLADYQDWLTNPFHTAKMRDYLIKLKIEFLADLNQPGVMGYQLTQANRKGYERGEPIMWHFKLERWMDYGATIAAAFASPDEQEIKDIRIACSQCIRNSKSGRSSISARMRVYASNAPPAGRNINGNDSVNSSRNYSHNSSSNTGENITDESSSRLY